MKLNIAFLCLVGSLFALGSCTGSSELVEVEMPLAVSGYRSFPEKAVQVDTSIVLQALFQTSNGCGRFSRVDTATVGTVFTMTYYAKYPVEGSDVVCTDISKPLVFRKTFSPRGAGTYTFRFWKSETEFEEKLIVVEE